MAKVRFHPLLEYIRGTIKGMVSRRTQKGKTSVYMSPYMSRVKWVQPRTPHRERMAEAYAYASQATKDPEIKAYYLKMAWEQEHKGARTIRLSRTITRIATICWETGFTGMRNSGGQSTRNGSVSNKHW